MSDKQIQDLQVSLEHIDKRTDELHVALFGCKERHVKGLVVQQQEDHKRLRRIEVVGLAVLVAVVALLLGPQGLVGLLKLLL